MATYKDNQSRRYFIKKSMVIGSVLPLLGSDVFSNPLPANQSENLRIFVFSKHLQFLNYRDMADAAASMGFDGVDLTVRPNGHVLPERVEDDLPEAMEAIKRVGLSGKMITTAVDDAVNLRDRKLLQTAAKTGITHYRMNWFKYPEEKTIPQAIEQFTEVLSGLSDLNKKLNLTGCYQNHSGNLAGASLWELWEMLKNSDPSAMGVQYDVRHAMVEGGLSWKNGLRLIQPQIRMLALKDHHWVKKNGAWLVENVPLGHGMVDFKEYFSLLKQYNINVPVSLHFEYPLGGAEHGSKNPTIDNIAIFSAMKKDLRLVRDLWQQA